jgi:antiphage defense system Thoeris ThsB-like protein
MAAKRKVFSALDYDSDRLYQNLLRAWNANPDFEFTWAETSPTVAIDSTNAATVKAALAKMINEATHFLCIIGKSTAKSTWVDWEIRKAIELRKKLVGVKIERENPTPSALLNSGASWALSFTQEPILKALREA